MRYFQTWMIICSILLLSCAGVQTKPTCKVEYYGIIDFVNHTDVTKYAAYCLMDEAIECKPRLFHVPVSYVPTRIRLQPGMYQIGLRLLNNSEYALKVYEVQVKECEVTTFTFALQNKS